MSTFTKTALDTRNSGCSVLIKNQQEIKDHGHVQYLLIILRLEVGRTSMWMKINFVICVLLLLYCKAVL